ncbi:MAG: CDP-6-deoxy-delta-3,4-glucoseen reductase [Pseudomonadota bacterium]
MSHQVTIEPSGHTYTVEEGESLLDAGLRHGIALPYGCRNGACGSCKGRLLAGEVAYQGQPPGLDAEMEAEGWALLCQAEAIDDLRIEIREVGSVAEIPVKTLPARIQKIEPLADDVMAIWLRVPQTERLQFLPGQYVDFLLPDGQRRSFSMANPPHEDDLLEFHIRHMPGGRFTAALFGGELKEKDILRIEGPHGSFFWREGNEGPVILVGGGTGIAPLKAIIEHALAEGTERPLHLYWGVRSESDLYMADTARGWAEAHANVTFTPVLSEPGVADWAGRTGYVHEAVLADFPDLTGYEVYTAGPPPMIAAMRGDFPARGLDTERFYADAFEPAGD